MGRLAYSNYAMQNFDQTPLSNTLPSFHGLITTPPTDSVVLVIIFC